MVCSDEEMDSDNDKPRFHVSGEAFGFNEEWMKWTFFFGTVANWNWINPME